MNTRSTAALALLFSLVSANFAFAQTYPVMGGGTVTQTSGASVSTVANTIASGCVMLTRNLSQGDRGSDVLSLQNFLVGERYPGSGTWMLTGYFGPATKQAVINFQTQHGLSGTGYVDANTRNLLQGRYCGGNYTYTPSVSYGNTVAISSLSVTSGPVGTSVTVYGTGFDPLYNSVYFGNMPIAATIGSNSNAITFTVPAQYTPICATAYACSTQTQYITAGTYPVYVSNTRGTSNSIPFTVTSGAFGCALYGYPYCGGYGNGPYGNPIINSMQPLSGGVGTTVTILGSGFSLRNNTVLFGPGVISGLTSANGTSLSFIVPTNLIGYGSQALTLGTYNVSVKNETGATSNYVPFTLTSLGNTTIAPTISVVNAPSALNINTTGVWTLTINNQSNLNVTTSVVWGDESMGGTQISSPVITPPGQQIVTFTHTYSMAGTYSPTFKVSNGTGGINSAMASVVVSSPGSTGAALSLTGISPNQGRVGTLVTLTGTGFAPTGNIIHFGLGGTANVTSSNNNTTLYYVIPAYISPCDVMNPGNVCAQYLQQVTPNTYPIWVRTPNGQTSAIQNFTVLP